MELSALAGVAVPEWRVLRIAGIKLAANATLGLAGIVGAPITFGLSLLLTGGSVAMIVWDGIDFTRDIANYQSRRRRLLKIRAEVAISEADLAAVVAEIEQRTRR